jgi:uncharacterized protein YdbL (DUF1318 family)
MKRPMTWLMGLALAAALGGTAQAQTDPVVEQARAQGIVGEQADGYLGFAKSPSADVKSRVDAINIKRRAFYTDLAAKRGVTVQEVAAATGCELFSSRVAAGEAYRTEGGQWATRSGGAPVQMPSYCK